jgi:hypothetical protein
MAILSLLVSLLALTVGIDAHVKSPRSVVTRETSITGPTPRVIVYVQTFTVNGDSSENLSLLPLLTENTGVTHVIFAMTHLNSVPGDIHLNDNPYNASVFDEAWSDAKQLQAGGIKVMATMGGAGDDSYTTLASNVSLIFTIQTPTPI